MFELNVGRMDSLLRIVIGGSVVIYAAGLLATPLNFAAIALSLYVLASGLMGTDLLYSILSMTSAERTPMKQKGK